MKKFYFGLVTLLLSLVAVPTQAQLEELNGKVITAFGPATTEIQTGQWYVMQNGGRGTYAYEKSGGGALMAIATGDVTFVGQTATDYANYLVRFLPVEGQESNYYYMQTGTGTYWGALSDGSNYGTTATADNQYVATKVSGLDDWWGFVCGEFQLDCNAAGYTVAGWYDTPTTKTSNAAWQVVPVTLTDQSDVCAANITYNYAMDDQVLYSYTQIQRGPKSTGLEVVFDAPGTRYGVKCSDATKESVTINEDKDIEVTYNYTWDAANPMPFQTTTVSDGAFAESTKWYYLGTYYTTNNYCYTTGDDEYLYYQKSTTHPIDLHYMYAFTGNPLKGYKIYNYTKGASVSLDASDDVTFAAEGVDYFLYAGSDNKGFSFNQSTNAKNYLNAYSNQISIYASYTDTGSAFTITEVSDDELAQAKVGVVTCVANIEDGHTFAEGESLDEVQIVVAEEEGSDLGISIAEGMETGKITLTDQNGNVVATPTYKTDSETSGVLFITFDPAFGQTGKYTLNIPAGLIKGNTVNLPNQAIKLTYTFAGAFVQRTVTARAWRYYKNEFREYTVEDNIWQENLPYSKHNDSDIEYYTCKVQLISADEIKLIDWEGNGVETDTLDVKYDSTTEFTSKSTHNGQYVNNVTPDESSWGASWIETQVIRDGDNTGVSFYPWYSNVRSVDGYGQAQLQFYSNANSKYFFVCFDWYNDDRYAWETLDGKVYKNAFKELGYNNDDYPSYTVLPFGDADSYDVEVQVNKDTIIIKNYEGQSDIKLTVKDGGVAQVNGAEPETGKRNLWVSSPVVDGVYGGWYCYLGFDEDNVPRSPAKYDPATQSGYAVLWGYDYATWNYRYIYVGIGVYEPILDGTETYTAAFGTTTDTRAFDVQTVLASVNGWTQETAFADGNSYAISQNPAGQGKFWNAQPIMGTWTNEAALKRLNAFTGIEFTADDFSEGSTLKAAANSNGAVNAILEVNMDGQNEGDNLTLYTTIYGWNCPIDTVCITGLADGYTIQYAANDGDGFVTEPTFSQDLQGVTLLKINGKLTSDKKVTVTSTTRTEDDAYTAKPGFQIASYAVTAGSATGISTIESTDRSNSTTGLNGKYLRNGRLVIVKDGKTYNAAGQIVK